MLTTRPPKPLINEIKWDYIFKSPAVLKKQINCSLYSVSVVADPINMQLLTSGTASECYLAHMRCLSAGEAKPFTASFMLQTTSFWRERFLSGQLEPNLNKMGNVRPA